jgi:hypothetical protein
MAEASLLLYLLPLLQLTGWLESGFVTSCRPEVLQNVFNNDLLASGQILH